MRAPHLLVAVGLALGLACSASRPRPSGGDAPLGFGVGGQTRQALGRVAAVRVGPLVFRDVLTSFSEDTRGVAANNAVPGYLAARS